MTPDKTANSHATPKEIDDPKEIIVWLGDDEEPALNAYYKDAFPSPGWYFLIDMGLAPYGPYNTSKEAYDAYYQYISEK